jgi:hypothetical protein
MTVGIDSTRTARRGGRTAAAAAAVALGIVALASAPARADIIFYDSPGGIQPEENVLLVSNQVGPAIIGTTNQTDSVVNFTQPVLAENLTTPASGQARIAAVDGAYTSLRTSLASGTFSLFEANPIFLSGGVPFNVIVTEDNGTKTTREFTSGSGQSYFGVQAIAGQRISFIDIVGPTNSIQDVRQIRIGGVQSTLNPVPEPGAVAFGVVMGGGLLGLVARGRRRRGGSAPSGEFAC